MDLLSFVPGFGGGILSALGTVIVGLVGLRLAAPMFPQTSKIFGYSQSVFYGPVSGLSHLVNALSRRQPFVLIAELLERIKPERVEEFLDRLFAHSPNDLLAGRLENVAKRMFPPEKFPRVWRRIPGDLRRSPVSDGRLINRESPSRLSAKFIDTTLIAQALRNACTAALIWFPILFVAWSPAWWIGGPVLEKMEIKQVAAETQINRDVWGQREAIAIQSELAARQQELSKTIKGDIRSGLPNGLPSSILVMTLIVLGATRAKILESTVRDSALMRNQTKDALVRYKDRMDSRVLLEEVSYVRQIDFANAFQKTPLIPFGKATGIFSARGVLSAPMPGQSANVSFGDMALHTIVFGGTGGGKTRLSALPRAKKMLELRRALAQIGTIECSFVDEEDGRQIVHNHVVEKLAMYVTDGKGALWRDIFRMCEELGMLDDVRVIGFNEAAGEYGVKLFHGLSSEKVADMLFDGVASQGAKSGGNEDFFRQQAKIFGRAHLALLEVLQFTSYGIKYEVERGELVYGPTTLVRCMRFTKVGMGIIGELIDAFDDPQQYKALAPYDTQALWDALDMIIQEFIPMPEKQKAGVLGFVANILDPFSSNMAIRRTFGAGFAKRMITVDEFFDKIVLVNLPSQQFGAGARTINTFLKLRLFEAARVRNQKNPKIGEMQKLWFLADEYQELVDSSELGDGMFWNVARSSGLMGHVQTQGHAALQQALGSEVAAANFVQQFRNKIFMRLEDKATVEYLTFLAGKTRRSLIFNEDWFESWQMLCLECGDPLQKGPSRLSGGDFIDVLIRGPFMAFQAGRRIEYADWDEKYRPDYRFIPSASIQAGGDSSQKQAMAQAWHRYEDKNFQYLTEGNEEHDVFTIADFNAMGSSHGVAFWQRSGHMLSDILDLEAA